MYCPKGTAFLWVKHTLQVDAHPQPTVISSSGKHDFIGRYEYTGTRDYTGFCVIPSALEFATKLGGFEKIQKYCHDLAVEAGRYLSLRWNTATLVSDGDGDGDGYVVVVMML